MNNQRKYLFSDFTHDNYKKLLYLTKVQYKFKLYHDKSTNEKSPTEPFSYYGVTKLSAEHLVNQYRDYFQIANV